MRGLEPGQALSSVRVNQANKWAEQTHFWFLKEVQNIEVRGQR